MKWIVAILLAALLPGSGLAQVFTGRAVAIDGDTLDLGGTRVRLIGIDAPETNQTCARDGKPWACGQEARSLLASLIADRPVTCEQRDQDAYGRIVGICSANRIDLSKALAAAGLAVPLATFSTAYLDLSERAKSLQLGIWSGEFLLPADFRATDPGYREQAERLARTERTAKVAAARGSSRPRANGVFFRNCNDARAAGAAPLYRGQPG